jgi:hypothetical protein
MYHLLLFQRMMKTAYLNALTVSKPALLVVFAYLVRC